MAKKKTIDILLDYLACNTDQSIAQLAEATGMSTNGVSATISNYNKGKPEGERIMGHKMPGKAHFVYWLESAGNRGIPKQQSQPAVEKSKKPRVFAEAMPMAPSSLVPSLEQSTGYLAQYISHQLRQEFEANLANVVANAVRDGIGAMMVGIREAVAGNMTLTLLHKPLQIVDAGEPSDFRSKSVSAIMAEDIAIPATKKEVTATVNTAALMEAVEKHERATNHVSSPILNVVSTRTKPREKTVAQPAEVANQAPEASQAKRKVIICSLLPMQHEIIRKEFGELMNLRMFYRDQEKALTKSVNHGDDVILMGDFISHRITQRIEAVGGKIEIVMGGLTKLREKLTEMYCTTKEAA